MVREVRRQVQSAWIDVLIGVAQHHLAHQQPEKAVAYLEEAGRRDPSREDVVKQLAVTYEETGRRCPVSEVKSRIDLGQDEA